MEFHGAADDSFQMDIDTHNGFLHKVVIEGSSPPYVPVLKFSWTDEFLRRMRALATAAQFAEAEPQEMDVVDNIAILASYPGDRHWRLYRPDPHH